MNFISKCYWTAKGVGWDNVPRRLLQAWRVHSGYLRRALAPEEFSDTQFEADVSASPDETRRALRLTFPRLVKATAAMSDKRPFPDDENQRRFLWERCEKALRGDYLFFGHWYGQIGWPPDFNLDPVNGLRYPIGEPSSKTARSGPPRDDVKLVWEASRFSMAFYFARAYSRSGDPRWAEAFWQMFDSWLEQSPPMLSVAWGCGQESTFRMMAILFAACVTLSSDAATDERLNQLTKFVWRTGRLIDRDINYALSQKNNHGISEAVGLATAGFFLSRLSKATSATRWIKRGTQFLIGETRRQIYRDGSFVQNSMNYHRVLIDDLLWASVVFRNDFPDICQQKLSLAVRWLSEFADESGRVPNYGPNDGAQVLPLSATDYLDYRPVLQAASWRCFGQSFYAPGPWDEKRFWLFDVEKPPRREEPKRETLWRADEGGYYLLRGRRTWASTRCHSYKDRPGEPDMLQFDLWFNGRNIVRDGGSYRYYTTEPILAYFQGTQAQNTPEVNGRSLMEKGPRFLQFYWTKSKTLHFEENDRFAKFEGEHYGYWRLPGKIVIRRRVVLSKDADSWTVEDRIFARKKGKETVTSRFRLEPGNWERREDETFVSWIKDGVHFRWKKAEGFRASLEEGFESLYYGRKESVPVVVICGDVKLGPREVCLLEYSFTFPE